MDACRRRLLAGLGLAIGVGRAGLAAAASDDDPPLPFLSDLRGVLQQVQRLRAPLLVLFSTPGCPYCGEVRRNYLAPRLAEQASAATPSLLIREVEIADRSPLVDAEGRTTTRADFAASLGVRVVPVVMLFDSRLQPLAEPLVGIDRSGFYEAYLARAIDQAQRRMRP